MTRKRNSKTSTAELLSAAQIEEGLKSLWKSLDTVAKKYGYEVGSAEWDEQKAKAIDRLRAMAIMGAALTGNAPSDDGNK